MSSRTLEVAGVEVSGDHWINGERVSSKERFDDVSPIDESVLGTIARGTPADADAAVQAAHDAFPGWASTSAGTRQ